MSSEQNEITNVKCELADEANDLVNKIITEKDESKLNDLTNMFKVNQLKRTYSRTVRLNNLQDLVDAELMTRVESFPESIDNRELVSIMETTQRAIAGVEQSIDKVPTIQINNTTNEINVNNSGLNRESRAKVLDAVNAILAGAKEDNIVDVEVEKIDA